MILAVIGRVIVSLLLLLLLPSLDSDEVLVLLSYATSNFID